MTKQKPPDKTALQDALVNLTGLLPDAPLWLTVVRTDGVVMQHYGIAANQDRISAMIAAIDALGERIAKELGLGDLHYTITAGSDGLYLVVLFADVGYLLGLCFRRIKSWDAILSALWEGVIPLQTVLEGA